MKHTCTSGMYCSYAGIKSDIKEAKEEFNNESKKVILEIIKRYGKGKGLLPNDENKMSLTKKLDEMEEIEILIALEPLRRKLMQNMIMIEMGALDFQVRNFKFRNLKHFKMSEHELKLRIAKILVNILRKIENLQNEYFENQEINLENTNGNIDNQQKIFRSRTVYESYYERHKEEQIQATHLQYLQRIYSLPDDKYKQFRKAKLEMQEKKQIAKIVRHNKQEFTLELMETEIFHIYYRALKTLEFKIDIEQDDFYIKTSEVLVIVKQQVIELFNYICPEHIDLLSDRKNFPKPLVMEKSN